MKKLLLIMAGSLIGLGAFAQEGFHIGVKGGMLGTYMYNTDLSNSDGNYVESRFSWGNSISVTTNYHFSETVGLGLDLTFANMKQDYIYYSSGNIDATLEAKYMRIPLLVHFNSDPGSAVMFKGFFGPQISLMNGATLTSTYVTGTGTKDPLVVIDGDNVEYTYNDRAQLSANAGLNGTQDVKGRMEGSTIGALLGLGMAINATEFLNIDFGITLGYDFTDAGTPFMPVNVPNTKSDFLYDEAATPSESTAPTNIINGGINIGINYIIN